MERTRPVAAWKAYCLPDGEPVSFGTVHGGPAQPGIEVHDCDNPQGKTWDKEQRKFVPRVHRAPIDNLQLLTESRKYQEATRSLSDPDKDMLLEDIGEWMDLNYFERES